MLNENIQKQERPLKPECLCSNYNPKRCLSAGYFKMSLLT